MRHYSPALDLKRSAPGEGALHEVQFRLYGDWFVGFSEMPSSLAFD